MFRIQGSLPLCQDEFLAAPDNDRLVMVLNNLDLEPLLHRLGAGRRGPGRRGVGPRALLYALIAAWVYELHSIAHLRRELLRNGTLRMLCGIPSLRQVPSEDAFGRLLGRLADNPRVVEQLFEAAVMKLRALLPELGRHVAVDGTAVRAWSKGFRQTPSDPDASWGKRRQGTRAGTGFWFGYKVHLAVDTREEIPLAYTVTTAKVHESTQLAPLLNRVEAQQPAGHLEVVVADASYDGRPFRHDVWGRGALPIIDYNRRSHSTPTGYSDDLCPLCPCGTRLRYLGRDRDYVKYTSGADCLCADRPRIRRWRIDSDIRLHAPVPRHTRKWQDLYDERPAVERVNSRLKGHLRLDGLRHRGLAKVRVHVGLSLLVLVAGALGMVQAGHKEWARSVTRLIA
jgi:IS5 family transposase